MPISIFIAADAEDKDFLADIKNHFAPLMRNSDISLWDESQVQAGEDFEAVQAAQLAAADVVLLLLSADFMATKMGSSLLQTAFTRLNLQEIALVPVIVRACSWDLEPSLQGLKVLPETGKPINQWEDKDTAYQQLVQQFQGIIDELLRLRTAAEESRLHEEKIEKFTIQVLEKDVLADTLRQKIADLYTQLDAAKTEEQQNLAARKEMWQELDAYYNANLSLYEAQGYDEVLPFSEGLSAIKTAGKWGFIDKTGQVAIACEYEHVGAFTEGLAVVEKMGNFGFINKRGEIAIPLQFNNALSFVEGLASVKMEGKYGFIDKIGKVIIPIHYDAAWHFSEGIAAVQRYDKWGFVDKTGTRITPLQYGLVQQFAEGFAAVMQDNKWGFIDNEGNKFVLPIYDEAKSFEGGIAQVLKEDVWLKIDREGKAVGSAQVISNLS